MERSEILKAYHKAIAEKEQLVRNWNSILYDYREYQRYYTGRTPDQARMAYYSEMLDLCEVGPYEEGRFSLEFTELPQRMKENRKERNELTIKIQFKNEEIKNLHRKLSQG